MLLIKRSKRGQVTFTKCKGEVQKLANFCKMVNIKSSCGLDRKKRENKLSPKKYAKNGSYGRDTKKSNYVLKNTYSIS